MQLPKKTRKATEKTCSACQKLKPAQEFYGDRRSRDGLTSQCKKCHRAGVNGSYNAAKVRCKALTSPRGRVPARPCKKWAVHESEFCNQHDPAFSEVRERQIEAIASRAHGEIVAGEKRCIRCETFRPFSEFGDSGLCRSCRNERQRSRAKQYRVKAAARAKLTRAVATGKITRPTDCEGCGVKEVAIEGHHPDYKKPLDVEWVCRKCHADRHFGGAA